MQKQPIILVVIMVLANGVEVIDYTRELRQMKQVNRHWRKILNKDKIIDKLKRFQKEWPDCTLIVETPNGTVSLKIGDALIYEGMKGEIVIDSE